MEALVTQSDLVSANVEPAKSAYVEVKIPPHPTDGPDSVRVVCLSDSHSLHQRVVVPPGDILIHCGDFTNKGTEAEIQAFAGWIGDLPHPIKLLIHGNHEAGPFSKWDPRKAAVLIPQATFVNNALVQCKGLSIFGIPWKLQFTSHRTMPKNLDILFLHEPPRGILDGGFGCDIALRLAEKARVVLFGHIHEAHGVHVTPEGQVFINCALANDGMVARSIARPAFWFDIPVPIPKPPKETKDSATCTKLNDE